MVDVAQEAGIGRATLYLYFGSKEEIALAAMDRVNEGLRLRLVEIADQVGSAEDRLRLMLSLRVLYRFDFAAALGHNLDDVYRHIREAYLARRDHYDGVEIDIFVQILSQGRENGELDFEDARETAATLLSCTNALLPFSLSARELSDRQDVSGQVHRTADLLMKALRKPGV
jgi:AcrR family transcriptional regulator